jgi:hypothetical protein
MARMIIHGFYQLCWGTLAFVMRRVDNGRYFRVIRLGDVFSYEGQEGGYWARRILWGVKGKKRELLALVRLSPFQYRKARALMGNGRWEEAQTFLERDVRERRGAILFPTGENTPAHWALDFETARRGIIFTNAVKVALLDAGYDHNLLKVIKAINGGSVRNASGPKATLHGLYDGELVDFDRRTETSVVRGGTFILQWKVTTDEGSELTKLVMTPEADQAFLVELISSGPGTNLQVAKRNFESGRTRRVELDSKESNSRWKRASKTSTPRKKRPCPSKLPKKNKSQGAVARSFNELRRLMAASGQ